MYNSTNYYTEFHSFFSDSNIETIMSAPDLHKIRIDDSGNVKIKTVWQRITYAIGWHRKQEDQKLHDYVENVITKVDQIIKKKSIIPKIMVLDEIFDKKIKNLFFEKLSQLDTDIFDRKLITKNIENLLNPQIEIYRKEKEIYPVLKDSPQKKLIRKVEKARLAIQLGVGNVAAAKGVTGTMLLKSVRGKKLGVFKLENPKFSLYKQFKHALAKMVGQLYYLSPNPHAQAQSETAAYLLDQKLGFNLISPTFMVDIDGQRGSFQIFIDGYKEAKEEINKIEAKEAFTKEELNLFQRMVVFDYLLGNMDRHEENWFVKVKKADGSDATEISDIKMIDNANCFIKRNVRYLFRPIDSKQYDWVNLKLSNLNFTDQTLEFIKKLNRNSIEEYCIEVAKAIPEFLNEDMKKLLLQRFEVLKRLRNHYAPTVFGNLITDNQIEGFITHMPIKE